MSINYQIIGKRIREIRKREKISQEKLAERSELSTQYISQIETAARRASLTSLVNIAGALNVGIEELLYGNIPIRSSECQKETAQIFRDCTVYEKMVLLESLKEHKRILRENECFLEKRNK